MRRVLASISGLWTVVAAVQWLSAQPASQAPPQPPAAARAVPTTAPPRRPTPLDEFGALLKAAPGDRERVLALKPESQRKILETKLQEYAALPEGEREVRLRLLQLRWYLQPLMQVPATNRADKLAAVPPSLRPLIEERLGEWDLLPPALQKEVFENNTTLSYFIRLESSAPSPPKAILPSFSPDRRQKLETGLAQWRRLTRDQRLQMLINFDRFFELKDKDRQKAFEALSLPEREQIKPVLDSFPKLPREQRYHYLEAFHKFASLPPAERDQLLRNAERWKTLPDTEKRTWREMAEKLPPLPPGFPSDSWPPLPPLPAEKPEK